MTNFKLNITKTTQTEGSSDRPSVDWEAFNNHVIQAAGTATKARSIPGFISGIYDLGEQNRPDYEEPSKVAEKDEEDYANNNPGVYFKTEGGKRIMCRPQKPCQQIAMAVDFPQIIVDKGQFFGESNPQPLRLLLNGEFTVDGERVVGKPFSLIEKKHDNGRWAFSKNNKLHQLAESCGLLDKDGLFTKERLTELLGKAAQFQFRVYMKEGRNDPSKKYFTEEIKLAGMVPEGVPIPEFDESLLHGVNLMGENDPSYVKQLRLAIKNTIKRANNYAESDIKHLLEASESRSESVSPSKGSGVAPRTQKPPQKRTAHPVAGPDDVLDDDIPF